MLNAFIDVTQYENFKNKVSEDPHFLKGDLQRVHARYLEVVDPNISDIIENAITVKTFIEILNLLRSEAQYIGIFIKTEDDYQETVSLLVTFMKTTVSKLGCKRAILLLGLAFKPLFTLGSSKDVKAIQRELNIFATIQNRDLY